MAHMELSGKDCRLLMRYDRAVEKGAQGMGIWQDVCIEGRSNIFIHDIFVRPTGVDKVEVWVELYSTLVGFREITLDISIYGQNFKETVFEHMKYNPFTVTEGYTHMLKIERGLNYLKIPVEIPESRLWETTEPWLYQAQIRVFDEEETLLDASSRQFGMRFFSMDTNCNPKGRFYLNGKRIKFRGVNSQGREQRMVFLKRFDDLLDDYLLAKVAALKDMIDETNAQIEVEAEDGSETVYKIKILKNKLKIESEELSFK